MSPRDTLFSKQLSSVKEFAFDENVASVFDDMIARSVPLYEDIQKSTVKLALNLVPDNATVYDLGCSTGKTLLLLHQALSSKNVKLIGIDNSQAMLKKCAENIARAAAKSITLVEGDITSAPLSNADLVIMHFTLQFIPCTERIAILRRIADNLRPQRGALLLSEKVLHDGERVNQLLIDAHLDFKREHGYSELEIAQKREALENVLTPLTVDENKLMLEEAGFQEVAIYAKWYNFAAFVALP